MIRKLFIVGAVAALPFGLLIRANSAGAVTKIDVSNDKITCNTVFGSVKIKPALTFTGGAGATSIKVKGTIDGCTDTTNGAVKILASKFTGSLIGTSTNCTSLLGTSPASGSIVVKWKADKTSPIVQTSSTLTVTTISGGTFPPGGPFGAAAYGSFSLGGATVAGAFTGGDGGATSTSFLLTSQDAGAEASACSGSGLSAISLGIGTLTLQ